MTQAITAVLFLLFLPHSDPWSSVVVFLCCPFPFFLVSGICVYNAKLHLKVFYTNVNPHFTNRKKPLSQMTSVNSFSSTAIVFCGSLEQSQSMSKKIGTQAETVRLVSAELNWRPTDVCRTKEKALRFPFLDLPKSNSGVLLLCLYNIPLS